MIAGWGNGRFDYAFGVGGGNNYARIMQGFLIATNDKAQLIPGIATEWGISSDGKTWTVTVRDGAKFHDGTALKAEDVWWTWMHYWGKDESGSAVERATQSSAQALGRIVDKVEQPGPNKASITTKVPDSGFAGGMISEAAANWYGVMPKRPKVHDSAQEVAYDKAPIAAGPMKLLRHVPSEVMAFERFDDFYYQPKNGFPEDRRVRFKSLDLRLVPEEATRVAAIRAGEADIAPGSLATRKQVEAGGGRMVFGPEGIYISALPYGCYRPQYPCYDKRVRQALAYAIDKGVIRDKLFGGPEVFQVRGWAHVTPSSIGYSPDLDPFPFDPAKARQLLADAGYPGGKGFGKFIVTTWVSTATPFLPESAQLAAEFWRRELGLDVEVVVGDEANLKRQALTEELFGQFRWADNEARLDGGTIVRSSYGTPTHAGRRHENPELFALVNKTQAVIDPAERAVAYNNLYKRLRDEHYVMGIGYINIPWAVGPRVLAWQPWPLAFYPSNLHGITLKP
jgi:ABC-type transport system substrate-binding protein